MFDLIIRGASIIDGTGRAAYTGDAAVSDGRIAAVGELGAAALRPGSSTSTATRTPPSFAPAGAARSSPRA